MSKWLKSTTQKAWTVFCGGAQRVIPPCETNDHKWLHIGDDEYAELMAESVVKSLIKAGGILVLNEEPAELKNSMPMLQVTNTQLKVELNAAKERIAELEAQVQNATGIDIEAIKAEAVAAKQKELEDLDAKASAIIEEKDKAIAKLEKKIKKLSGSEE